MTSPLLEAFPLPDKYLDLRDRAAIATGRIHNGYADHLRDERKITGWTLHQSAMDRGDNPNGYLRFGSHWAVTRGGLALHIVDAKYNGAFANGFNARTISIEMVGLYAGIIGDHRTLWDNPATPAHEVEQTLTPEAIVTAMQIMRYEHTRLTKLGALMTKCLAHRQASGSRQSDPGEAVWRAIALPISEELGYDDNGPGFKIDDGRPVPHEWNPARTEKY